MPHYECDRCGACCAGHLIVEAYHVDVLREPRLEPVDNIGSDKEACGHLSHSTPVLLRG